MPDSDYLDLGFPDQADPSVKRQAFIDTLESGIDGYTAQDGSPEVIIGEGSGDTAADNEALAQVVARAIWREFGTSMYGLPPIDATSATALVTITLTDSTVDRVIDAGAQIAIGDYTFILPTALTVPASTASLAGVHFTSIDTGDATSGLTDIPVPITALAAVASYSLDEATAGGHDAEADDVYENRLRREIRSAGRPELAEDFAERMSRNPEVFSTLVLDGYNATTATSGNDATVTLVARNSAGLPISTTAKDERTAAILAEKVSGWNVFVIDPTYTTIGMAATISVWPGYDPAATQAAARAAVAQFLNPGSWGSTPTGEIPDWNQEPTVLRSEVLTALNNVPGVRHVTGLVLAAMRMVTAVASTDVFTATAHGFSNGDSVIFDGLTGGAPIDVGTAYYARDVTTNTFKIAATSGGAAINITTDLTTGLVTHPVDADVSLAGVAPLPLPGRILIAVA